MKKRERKIIRTKLLVCDFVMCFIIIIIGALAFFSPGVNEPLVVRGLLASVLLLYVVVWRYFIKRYFEMLQIEKESKDMVENNFQNEKMKEVIPIYANEYQEFILETLTKIAKFYAVIDSGDSENVKVYIVYNNESNKYYQFETIKKEFFINYYAFV